MLNDLSEQLQVSGDTIRRDLQELSEDGRIIKVHGGAVSLSFHNGSQKSREVYAFNQKKRIAKKAIELIRPGMFVLSSGGTTVIEVVRALPNDLNATFISGSLPVLLEYCNHPNINVVSIGDKISKASKISVGTEAIAKIRELKVDLCLLGINAINLADGVSDHDWDIVQMKKAMIESSEKTVCVTISEKLNSRRPIPICPLKKIDYLITELDPDHELLKPYAAAGVTVM